MRHFCLTLILAAILGLIVGCNKKGSDPPPPVTIKDGIRYFPMQEGNTWYYNGDAIIRKLDGDTTVNGALCQRLLSNSKTDEAWTRTSAKFSQHLLAGSLWFEPPLEIPLDLEKDKPFALVSQPHNLAGSDDDLAQVKAVLTFRGYVTKEILDATLDNCLQIDYVTRQFVVDQGDTTWLGFPNSYSEFYGLDIGLIDDGEKLLDSARIDGVKKP